MQIIKNGLECIVTEIDGLTEAILADILTQVAEQAPHAHTLCLLCDPAVYLHYGDLLRRHRFEATGYTSGDRVQLRIVKTLIPARQIENKEGTAVDKPRLSPSPLEAAACAEMVRRYGDKD